VTASWHSPSMPITWPYDQPASSSHPVASSPPIPPMSAAAVIKPAARLRLPVGNSSVRYTASAG
jgi:hypothetical protein